MDGISYTFSIVPGALGKDPRSREQVLTGLLDGYFAKGGHHININVFDRATLVDAMNHPEVSDSDSKGQAGVVACPLAPCMLGCCGLPDPVPRCCDVTWFACTKRRRVRALPVPLSHRHAEAPPPHDPRQWLRRALQQAHARPAGGGHRPHLPRDALSGASLGHCSSGLTQGSGPCAPTADLGAHVVHRASSASGGM